MTDSLGDRMKFYESQQDGRLLPLLPTMARLDGRAFHTFTRGFARPFDERLTNLMIATTKFLVEETNAKIGYTQSDEINLMWFSDNFESKTYFDNRIFKMVSILASACSVYFNQQLPSFIPEAKGPALFDCRVWSVPNKAEAVNCFIWRELDATRNSIQMAGQSKFSHDQLQNKNSSQIQEMLWQTHNINWNDYPAFFRRGTYVRRKENVGPYTVEELDKLPPLHDARRNPNLLIKRKETSILAMPKITSIANKEAVIFDGAVPITFL